MSLSDFESDQKQKRLSLIIELFFIVDICFCNIEISFKKFFLLLYESYYYPLLDPRSFYVLDPVLCVCACASVYAACLTSSATITKTWQRSRVAACDSVTACSPGRSGPLENLPIGGSLPMTARTNAVGSSCWQQYDDDECPIAHLGACLATAAL